MLVQLQNSPQKGPGHFVGTPAADFTFPGPADSLWCAVAVGGVSWIQEICPGSYGNSKKTQGCEGAGCPFPRKAAGPPAEPRNQRQAPAEVFGGGRPERKLGKQGSGNLSRIERKLEENWGSRVDYLGSTSRFFPSRPRRSLRNPRSWRVLATANRRDWSVRNSNCFCRVFHLSRNDRIAKGIVARNDF